MISFAINVSSPHSSTGQKTRNCATASAKDFDDNIRLNLPRMEDRNILNLECLMSPPPLFSHVFKERCGLSFGNSAKNSANPGLHLNELQVFEAK
jgi:hypothetical protein